MLAASRDHGEIVRIVKLAVHVQAEQPDQCQPPLHRHRQRRRDQVGAVAAQQQIDFVDLQQFGDDARHLRGVGLIVVDDQLHRPAQETAFGVDILDRDLQRQQGRLAVGRKAAGLADALTDGEGFGGKRR